MQGRTEPPAPARSRLGSGAASGRAPACSHQRSSAPAAGATSCPACRACPSPSRARAASTFTASLKPCSQHRPRGRDGTLTEHLPSPCQGRRGTGTRARALSFCFQEACSEHSIPGCRQRPSLCSQLLSQGHFPRKHLSSQPLPPSPYWNPELGRQPRTQTTSIQKAEPYGKLRKCFAPN